MRLKYVICNFSTFSATSKIRAKSKELMKELLFLVSLNSLTTTNMSAGEFVYGILYLNLVHIEALRSPIAIQYL